MMKQTNKPSHHVFAVRKSDGGKSFWTRIGAAWPNRDGEGFNLRLEMIPINGAEIVLRTPKDDEADQATA